MMVSILVIALPVLRICPVHSLVSQHQRVYGEARPQDGQRRPKLSIEDCIRNILMALKHMPVLNQDLQPYLHGRQA